MRRAADEPGGVRLPPRLGLRAQGGYRPDRITRNVYDSAGQLLTVQKAYGVTTANGFPATLQQNYAAYEYTPNGKALSVTNANRNCAELRWDGHDRQSCWIFPSKTIAGALGGPYAVNGLNQYLSAGPATFRYDANGNLAAVNNPSYASTSYVYDVENRLVSASGTDNALLAYDPLGRLWQVSSGSGTRRMVYDGDALVAEYDAAGTMLHRYVHGNDAGADDPLIWYDNLASGWRRALLADHQGSIVAVADMYGTAIADMYGTAIAANSYDPWGLRPLTNLGRFGYTGQAWVPELGLWYYKARLYSPTTGRFLQTDPVGYQDQINLYAYVGNDPVNRIDPSGNAGIVAAAPILCAGPQAAACGLIAGGVVIVGCAATQSCRDAVDSAVGDLRDRIRDLGKGLFNENQADRDEQDREASDAGREVITQGKRPEAGEGQIDNRGAGRKVGNVIQDAAKAAGVKPEQTKGGQPTVRFPDGTRATGYPNSKTTGGPSIVISSPSGRPRVKTREDDY